MGYKVVRIITAIILLLALTKQPYGFYKLLRWVVFGVSSYSIFIAYNEKYFGWLWIFLFIAILFNPIFPVYFDRTTWAYIDVCTAIIFIISIFKMKNKKENRINV